MSHSSPATPVTAEQVSDAVLAGAWVVDLRERSRFARAHLAGTVNVEYGERFARHVGWLVPAGDGIVLLTDSPTVVESAVRDLAGLGIDDVGHHVLDPGVSLPASYRVSDWAGYGALQAAPGAGAPRRVVVDVRPREAHDAGHLLDAVHVGLRDLQRVATTLPPGELWVHCDTGERAGVAASVLHRMGRSVVHVDDTWDRVGELALPVAGRAA